MEEENGNISENINHLNQQIKDLTQSIESHFKNSCESHNAFQYSITQYTTFFPICGCTHRGALKYWDSKHDAYWCPRCKKWLKHHICQQPCEDCQLRFEEMKN